MKNFTYLKALFSPFRPFKIRVYVGKTQIGTPYFLPRRWRKYTIDEAVIAARESMNDPKRVQKSFNEWFAEYRRYQKAVPRKIGFDYCDLGWKTKWDDTDYRFEWAPRISFVFFGYQIALIASAPEASHYWEAWLYYERDTDHNKTQKERIQDCRTNFNQIYKSYYPDGREEKIDYYTKILKPKYL